ncbi:alpha/beta hydrolase [Trinickia sp. LjRoot230]|uniref:alpha/beta fold hydrolase n=1 Tax=Trinickia sp. LjRoot230 TaxID=3342288 RepID=UPI003ED17295
MAETNLPRESRRMIGRLAAGLLLSGLIDAPARAQVASTKDQTAEPPAGFMSRYLTVDGSRMHYVEGGAGPVVLLLHGWPQTWWAWRKVMPLLNAEHHVIALDMPGLGKSDVCASGYTKRSLARRVRAFAAALGHKRVALVGHDLGAAVAYAYAKQFHDDVSALVVMDDPLPGLKDWDVVKGKWPRWHFAFHNVVGLPEALVSGRELIYLSWFYRNAFQANAITEADARVYAAAYSQPTALHAGFEYYRAFEQDAAENAKDEAPLTMPVLAVGGEHSPWRSYLHEQLEGRALSLEGVVVPECGHFIAEEQPVWLAQTLRQFLATPLQKA